MSSVRVLLAANTETTLTAVGIELMQTGFAVSTAQQTHEALAQLAAREYDVVILDYQPFTEAIRLLQIVRQRHPGLATVVVVPEGEPAVLEAALEAGAFDVLMIPLVTPLLHAALRRINEYRQLRRQLAAAPAISQPTAIMHDINNQLSGILGIAQLYLTDTDLPPDLLEDLTEIAESARRIRDLIQQARQGSRAPDLPLP